VELDLSLRNAGMPPQRDTLAAAGLPEKWNALFLGDGRPVDSAFLAPDSSVEVTLRVSPPQGVKSGNYQFQVAAISDDGSKARLARVREQMQGRRIDVLLVSAPENITYLTGYQTSGYFAYQALIMSEKQR
jgi:uncharacterized membrane protein